MKHIFIDIDSPNDPFRFNNMENYISYMSFVGFTTGISSHAEIGRKYELLHCTQIVEPNCNIVGLRDINVDIGTNFWTLYFDGSKSKEGAGVGCLLKY